LGPHNVIIRDLDGSLLEGEYPYQGSIISDNAGAINGTCDYVSSWNGHKCFNTNPDEFEWMMLLFEVLDENRMESVLSPFIIQNSNFYNKLTPMIDNREEIYDVSGERLPRY